MEAVIRPVVMYAFLIVVFTIAGKRTMAEMDTFDMVTLLIVSEAAQNALVGDNTSMTYAMIAIMSLVGCSILMAWFKARHPHAELVLEGGPVIIVENGRLLRDRMKLAYVDEHDILQAARSGPALERLDQIKFAILETDGTISVIPKASAK